MSDHSWDSDAQNNGDQQQSVKYIRQSLVSDNNQNGTSDKISRNYTGCAKNFAEDQDNNQKNGDNISDFQEKQGLGLKTIKNDIKANQQKIQKNYDSDLADAKAQKYVKDEQILEKIQKNTQNIDKDINSDKLSVQENLIEGKPIDKQEDKQSNEKKSDIGDKVNKQGDPEITLNASMDAPDMKKQPKTLPKQGEQIQICGDQPSLSWDLGQDNDSQAFKKKKTAQIDSKPYKSGGRGNGGFQTYSKKSYTENEVSNFQSGGRGTSNQGGRGSFQGSREGDFNRGRNYDDDQGSNFSGGRGRDRDFGTGSGGFGRSKTDFGNRDYGGRGQGRGRGRGGYNNRERENGFGRGNSYNRDRGGEYSHKNNFHQDRDNGYGRGGSNYRNYGGYDNKNINRDNQLIHNQILTNIQTPTAEPQTILNFNQISTIQPIPKVKTSNTQPQEYRINKTMAQKPIGLRCWPSVSIYIKNTKVSFYMSRMCDHICSILFFPYSQYYLDIYPGNIINQSPFDYKKKLKEKQKSVGQVYFQKCLGIKNFQAIAFTKIDKNDLAKIKDIMKDLVEAGSKLDQSFDSILIPYSKAIGNMKDIAVGILDGLQSSDKFRQIIVSTNSPSDFIPGSQEFLTLIQQLADKNQIVIQ